MVTGLDFWIITNEIHEFCHWIYLDLVLIGYSSFELVEVLNSPHLAGKILELSHYEEELFIGEFVCVTTELKILVDTAFDVRVC